MKQTAVPESLKTFSGLAKVFQAEEEFEEDYERGEIQEGDAIIIRYESPKGRSRYA